MIHTIQGIVEAAKGGQGGIIAVAAAHDEGSDIHQTYGFSPRIPSVGSYLLYV